MAGTAQIRTDRGMELGHPLYTPAAHPGGTDADEQRQLDTDPLLQLQSYTTLSYLELPVLAKLDVDAAENGTFLTGGVIYGYWIAGRFRQTQNGVEIIDQKFNLSGVNVRRSQWSVAVGLGRGNNRWAWEFRAQTSVTPFDRLIRSQNLVFGLHFSYRLPTYEERKAKRDAKEAAEEEKTE